MKEYRVVKMHSEELGREVSIYIMLPQSYFKSEKFYPVLYMHDGQNIFDGLGSYHGESWGILEAYEEHPDLPEVVIIGIENGGKARSDELVPFSFYFKDVKEAEYANVSFGGKTNDYLGFIINVVKPYIDKTFRTYKSPKNTGIMGSSFGGVCSTYAALQYTSHFSRFGFLSNAYFVVQKEMETLAKNTDLSDVKRLYMDVGTKEGSSSTERLSYVESNQRIYNILKEKMPRSRIRFDIVEDAKHNEPEWEKRFPDIIRFLFN